MDSSSRIFTSTQSHTNTHWPPRDWFIHSWPGRLVFTGLSSCRLFNISAHLSRNTFVLSAAVCPAERGDAVATLLAVISLAALTPLTSIPVRKMHLNQIWKAWLSMIGIYSTKLVRFAVCQRFPLSLIIKESSTVLWTPSTLGRMLALRGAAAGGQQSNVFGPDAATGPILLQTHLSHPCTGLTALPGGAGGGSCLFLVQWCHAGLPVVLQQSVPHLLAVLCSLGKSSLPAPSPLNRQSYCPCVCGCVCVSVYRSRGWLQQQFLSTHEQV